MVRIKPFLPGVAFHIETNHMLCRTYRNQSFDLQSISEQIKRMVSKWKTTLRRNRLPQSDISKNIHQVSTEKKILFLWSGKSKEETTIAKNNFSLCVPHGCFMGELNFFRPGILNETETPGQLLLYLHKTA